MVTIDTIAAQAQVSRSSVSKILRGHRGFNEQTRQRVMQVAEALNYRPNYLGRALAGGRTMTIGILVGSLDVPASTNKLRRIEAAASEADYLSFLIAPGYTNVAGQVRAVRSLAERRVDGVIVFLSSEPDGRLLDALSEMSVPVVYLDRTPEGAHHAIRVRREPAMEQVAEHLASLGHRRAGLFLSPSDAVGAWRKREPYQQVLARHGITLETGDAWTLSPEIGFKKHTYQRVTDLIRRPDRPTVLMMNNDDCAIAALAALADAGMSAPEDISLVGFDDLPISQYIRPALTTIHQPRGEVGEAAFAMLRSLIETPQEPVAPVHFDCELVIRGSTGPVKRQH